jgi:hypothetical protein
MIKLYNILKEVMVEDEKENTTETSVYDSVIKNALKVDTIPTVQGKYKLGDNKSPQGADLKIFNELYKVSPPKKEQEVGSAGTKGSGNGEIALYWLFKYQNPSIPAQDSRGVDNPDLIIDGYGVEVKSSDKGDLQLGRFGHKDYKEITLLLNDIFSLYALSSVIAHQKPRIPTASNFNQNELEEALESVIELHKDENLKKYADSFPMISNVYKKTDIIFEKLSLEGNFSAKEAGGAVLKKLILVKLTRKLMLDSKEPGYIVNISSNGNLKYYEITKEKIENLENSTIMNDNNVTAKQSFITIKPEVLFGK